MVQVVECLLCKHEALTNSSFTKKKKKEKKNAINKWTNELRSFSVFKKIQMSNKPMKRRSSLAIRKAQIKSTLSFHLIPVKMDIIKKIKKQQMLSRMKGEKKPWECKLVQQKLKTKLLYNPVM
jgi:hypothetical protein